MKSERFFLPIVSLLVVCVSIVNAHTERPANPATAPPKLLLLVHQQFKFGSESARQKLEASVVRACDRLAVPNSWIDLQSITGPPESFSFDPFDSFDSLIPSRDSISRANHHPTSSYSLTSLTDVN